MSKVDGMVEDGFETIRDAFAEAQARNARGEVVGHATSSLVILRDRES